MQKVTQWKHKSKKAEVASLILDQHQNKENV